MNIAEAEAPSVLDESENKAESLLKSWCHLTMVPENNWVKLEKKQVCWKDAWISKNEPPNQREFVTQYDRSRGNQASSGWMKIVQTARQSREKCSALA